MTGFAFVYAVVRVCGGQPRKNPGAPRTKQGYRTYTFGEFQKIFLYSVILMNKLQNYLEMNHDYAGKKNNALTEAFFTPDGLKVQVYGQMINRAGNLYPEFRLMKIKDSSNSPKS